MRTESFVETEIASQEHCWVTATKVASHEAAALPQPGERVGVFGCGTSWFMAQSYAALRERGGHGETDAFAASETLQGRSYDRVIAITRSGTTTEVLRALHDFAGTPSVTLTTEVDNPAAVAAERVIALGFADESSVVQTRFATTALTVLRASLGLDVQQSIRDVASTTISAIPDSFAACEQVTFLGSGWTYGLAQEAALKMREACGAWTEAYPAMEYRHGPISIAAPNRLVWMLGEPPSGLAEEVRRTGALFESSSMDPLAELVRVQRLAVKVARLRGLNPDQPRNLTRSVILEPEPT